MKMAGTIPVHYRGVTHHACDVDAGGIIVKSIPRCVYIAGDDAHLP